VAIAFVCEVSVDFLPLFVKEKVEALQKNQVFDLSDGKAFPLSA
jgi:hypothetical protein